MLNINILQKRINRLEELFPQIIRGLSLYEEASEKNRSELDAKLSKYKKIKGKILLSLMDESVFSIKNEYQAQLREKLQKLSIHGDPNVPDEFLKNADDKVRKIFLKSIGPEFPDRKMDELTGDFRISFSEYDYIWNKMHANLLIIKAGTFPESLKKYIEEIRECLAFWRHLAAATLLRTTLEISVQDLCTKNKLDDLGDSDYLNDKYDFWMDMYDKENIDSLDSVDLKGLTLFYQIDLLCSISKFSSFQDDCHKLREDTNEIVHNKVDLDKERAMDLTHRTFQLIHQLYEVN